MDYLAALSYHLAHPFSVKVGNDEVSLSPTEKQIAATTTAAAAGLVFGFVSTPVVIVAAPVVFYGMTAGFKRQNLNKYQPPEETLKTDAISTLYPPFISSSANNDYKPEPEPARSDDLAAQICYVMENKKTVIRDKKALVSELFDQTNNMTVFLGNLNPIFDNLDDRKKLEFVQSLPDHLQDPFFKHFLSKYFDIHSIPGDGNCCVYALVQAQNDNTLNKDDEKQYAQILREQVVAHIKRNRDAYEPFCEDFDEYLENMSQDKKWFGPQEIKAFAESAAVPVIIYNPNNVCLDARNQLRPYSESVLGEEYTTLTPKRIYLYHKGGNHYELLTPKRQVTPPPPLHINA